MMRDDENPPDMTAISRPPSLPPDDKVKLQLALTILFGTVVAFALVGAALGAVTKDALGNILMFSLGAIAGLLTGGSSNKR